MKVRNENEFRECLVIHEVGFIQNDDRGFSLCIVKFEYAALDLLKEIAFATAWRDHHDGFRSWLETAKKVRGNGIIAVSSRNHAIKALNTFMEHLYKDKLIAAYVKCEAFEDHLLNKRTLDDVIFEDEMERVFKALVANGHESEALLFRFLYFSGMRFNESLAISLGDLYQGTIQSPFLQKKLNAYGIKYHGHIVSDGQFGRVAKSGEVIRLPFKGCKTISEKNNRVIPIVDKILWNELVTIAKAKFDVAADGKDRRDILLFPNIDDTTATNRLKAAFKTCKLKYRSWHCLRHSRATFLIGETSDASLTRVWLGHKSE